MSERLEPNVTPVPNIVLDEIMRGLNEGQFKTLMAICRKTYGWGKHSDQISLSQLAEMTGMDGSNVARARKGLGNLITVIAGTATTASTYRLNIDISDEDLAGIRSDSSATSDHSATSVKGSDPSATYKRKQKKEDNKSGTTCLHACLYCLWILLGRLRVSPCAAQPRLSLKPLRPGMRHSRATKAARMR